MKLNSLSESQYIEFLQSLNSESLTLFATATDAGLNTPHLVLEHQRHQVEDTRVNIPKMRHEGGRNALSLLADQLESLSPQLYVQLVCQVNLLHDIVGRSVNYFAQRFPATLTEVRWRIDQKNTTKTTYEDAFEKIAPALLQSRSMREPLARVRGFDYRHFAAYEFEEGSAPDFLQVDYGLPPMEAINIQKLIRSNLAFQDSRASDGIQVADLLASGLRRLLRRSFKDQVSVARAMGQLTVQNSRDRMPVPLIAFGQEEDVSPDLAADLHMLNLSSKRLIKRAASKRDA